MTTTPRIADALVHLAEALDALTIESWTIEGGRERRTPAIEATMAEELERIHCALAPRGQTTILSACAEEIRRAVIEIEAARIALGGARSG